MMKRRGISILFVIFLAIEVGCKDPYVPPVIEESHNYLVVEGIINSGQDSSIITLSRTRNLGDTTSFIPELHARVFVEMQGGTRYALEEMGRGQYGIGQLNLVSGANYKLGIETINGSRYESDYVPVKETPAIDSLTWSRDKDITIHLSTHDPTNSTRYYRWEFRETWEYHAYYDTNLGYDYNTFQIYYRDSSQLLTKCWRSANSTSVLIGTSARLSEDIVDRSPINVIPEGSDKMSVRYSILVKQYALTQAAFEYWQLLKKQSQQLGTLFDPQPSQLIGNLHCVNNPLEPVIGYASISTVQESRLFIKKIEVPDWGLGNENYLCTPKIITPDSIRYYLADTSLAPAYYVTGGGLAIAAKPCVDCTTKGGTKQKPSYW